MVAKRGIRGILDLPTPTLPGSEERIRVLRARAGANVSLKQLGDVEYDERRSVLPGADGSGLLSRRQTVESSNISLPPKTFTARLRHFRVRAGLSQKELAERAAVSLRYVQALDRGEWSNPSRAILKRLAAALRVPFDVLADDPEPASA